MTLVYCSKLKIIHFVPDTIFSVLDLILVGHHIRSWKKINAGSKKINSISSASVIWRPTSFPVPCVKSFFTSGTYGILVNMVSGLTPQKMDKTLFQWSRKQTKGEIGKC